jgi:hypothetical protein
MRWWCRSGCVRHSAGSSTQSAPPGSKWLPPEFLLVSVLLSLLYEITPEDQAVCFASIDSVTKGGRSSGAVVILAIAEAIISVFMVCRR